MPPLHLEESHRLVQRLAEEGLGVVWGTTPIQPTDGWSAGEWQRHIVALDNDLRALARRTLTGQPDPEVA